MSAPNQLSFLPDDYLARKAQRRTNVICATLFLIVMGAITAAFMLSERSTHALVQRHDEVDRQYAEAAKRIEQVQEMQEKQRKMAHQAEVTASLLEHVPRSYLLAEFTNSMPAGVSLIDLSMESRVKQAPAAPAAKTAFEQKKAELEAKNKGAAAPAPLPQAKQYDVIIKLTGVARTDVQVAQFINKLSRSTLLKDVNLDIIDQYTVDADTVRKFQLDMRLNPDASIDPAKAPVKTAAVELGQAK
jgi:Tfp pilus assembly protein PilN